MHYYFRVAWDIHIKNLMLQTLFGWGWELCSKSASYLFKPKGAWKFQKIIIFWRISEKRGVGGVCNFDSKKRFFHVFFYFKRFQNVGGGNSFKKSNFHFFCQLPPILQTGHIFIFLPCILLPSSIQFFQIYFSFFLALLVICSLFCPELLPLPLPSFLPSFLP